MQRFLGSTPVLNRSPMCCVIHTQSLESDFSGKQLEAEKIFNKYRTLAEFDVPVSEEEKSEVANIAGAFDNFRDVLEKGKMTLNDAQEKLRSKLLSDLDSYGRGISEVCCSTT